MVMFMDDTNATDDACPFGRRGALISWSSRTATKVPLSRPALLTFSGAR